MSPVCAILMVACGAVGVQGENGEASAALRNGPVVSMEDRGSDSREVTEGDTTKVRKGQDGERVVEEEIVWKEDDCDVHAFHHRSFGFDIEIDGMNDLEFELEGIEDLRERILEKLERIEIPKRILEQLENLEFHVDESDTLRHRVHVRVPRMRFDYRIGPDGHGLFHIGDAKKSLKIKIRGDVRFEEGRVASISEDGRFEAEESGEIERKIVVTAGEDGSPNYDYSEDGEARKLDDEAREWLAGIVEKVESGEREGREVRRRVYRIEECVGKPRDGFHPPRFEFRWDEKDAEHLRHRLEALERERERLQERLRELEEKGTAGEA